MLSLSKHLSQASNPVDSTKRERCFDKLSMTFWSYTNTQSYSFFLNNETRLREMVRYSLEPAACSVAWV